MNEVVNQVRLPSAATVSHFRTLCALSKMGKSSVNESEQGKENV